MPSWTRVTPYDTQCIISNRLRVHANIQSAIHRKLPFDASGSRAYQVQQLKASVLVDQGRDVAFAAFIEALLALCAEQPILDLLVALNDATRRSEYRTFPA